MKISKLKYVLLGLVLLFATPTDTFSQIYSKFPTDVRYIGGGFNDKRPFFKTLEAALNDVKALATINRPYVFWISSDTVNVADWDSVFTESGLTMKDSIDVYYVAEGKIKWGGFGFGGSGSGTGTVIPTQTQTTTHYGYPNWDQSNSALATWIRNQAKGLDSIDQHIWDLIVYTDSVYLYIENDTLKVRTATITALVSATANRPDTTIIAYKAVNETITGDWIINGDFSINTGSIRLPAANNRASTSRIIWDSGNRPYYSGSGSVGDSVQLAGIDPSTSQLEDADVVGWENLDDAVKDSIAHDIVCLAFRDSAEVIAATQNVWSVITNATNDLWGAVNIDIGEMVIAGDSVQFSQTGYYEMNWSLSYSGSNTDVWYISPFLDNTRLTIASSERGMSGTTPGSSSGNGVFYVDAINEWLSLRCMNDVNANDLTALTGDLTIRRIK